MDKEIVIIETETQETVESDGGPLFQPPIFPALDLSPDLYLDGQALANHMTPRRAGIARKIPLCGAAE